MPIAIITGQSRGLGAALAHAFTEAGYTVPRCTRAEMDVSMAASIFAFTDGLTAVDVLINNAAILGPVDDFQFIRGDEWQKTINTNLLGPTCLTQQVLPKMPAGGRIINIAGGGATGPLPRRSAYATSKAALVRFTECLAAERPDLRINSVLPGPLPTHMWQEIVDAGEVVEKPGPDAMEQAVVLCLYLASDEAKGISGKCLSARYDRFPFTQLAIRGMQTSDVYTLRRLT